MNADPSHRAQAGIAMKRAALASVALAVILMGAKAMAWLESGSVAMLGSLADTSLDALASLITFWAVRYSAQPADPDHRFGHGKAEAIAALMQSGLIVVSAGAIGWRGLQRIMHPAPVATPDLGIGVSVLAIAGTLALVAYQRRVVARTGSIAIRTDQLHYQSDLLLNTSVILALAAETWLKLPGADAFAGIGIAVYLAWGAIAAARNAIDMLMDRELEPERRQRIIHIATGHPRVRGIHELRTRASGLSEFIQFHVIVDPALTIFDAHAIADEVEAIVQREFEKAEVLIHVDPDGIDERGQKDVLYADMES